MRILVCSKYKYKSGWQALKETLEEKGHTIITPADIDMNLHGHLDAEMNESEYLKSVECFHKEIRGCDAMYVFNPGGEFGKSMMLEIGYAAALGKRIIAASNSNEEPSLALFIKEILRPEELS